MLYIVIIFIYKFEILKVIKKRLTLFVK